MSVITKVLLGVGAVFGGGILLVVLLIAVGALVGSRPQPKSTMTLSGWAVDAPGQPAGDKVDAQAQAKGILHRTTNSEFSIATKRVARPGQSFTPQQIVDGMKRVSRITDERPVRRGNLEGVRFSMPAPANGALGTLELFKIDDFHILLLTYISGVEKERVHRSKARFDEAKTAELDDPEAFFASLRRL